MSARFLQTKTRGQSIPLIALLIVVLIGAVGLSVDVGNNYAQQRNTVRATNASALAGMNAMIQGASDPAIKQVIQQSLKSNNVDGVYNDPTSTEAATAEQRIISAYYLDAKGNFICNIGSCGSVPGGATYVQVNVNGDVSTYFARVLDRPTLPVKAQAFAGRCSPVEGVYPIGVQSSNLDSRGFLPPQNAADLPYYKTYKDAEYPTGLTQRRIYLKDNANSPGNFSFLRWKSANSAGSNTEMINMLAGAGNLADGFDEGLVDNKGNVTWPDPNSQPPMVAGKVVYPVKPHEINAGDWIYANTGLALSSGVQAELQKHITNKDVMILPIVTPAIGAGSNATFQLAGLGSFYLLGVGGSGANSYLDLVYIGTANSIACLSTPAVVSNTLGINGAVFLKPRWGQPQNGQPIAYQIIMDVSGSMSWNFQGQGNLNGTGAVRQCEAFDGAVPQSCPNGGGDYWKTASERRIYVLKNALTGPNGFIESMRAYDTMRIITFTTDNSNNVNVNTGPSWSTDKAALKQTVMDAGKVNNDPYRTSGGTPGASALQKAYNVLVSSPPPAATNGQPYKNVVIYMTDGVANMFLTGNVVNYAKDICPEYNGDSRALNSPRCQYDALGMAPSSYGPRPISAMILQAANMKSAFSTLQLFVLALGQVNVLGLDQVASDPSLVFAARDPSVVNLVLDQIQAKAEGPCIPMTAAQWQSHIDSGHTANLPALNLPLGVYGYAYLYDSNHVPVSVPWTGQGTDPRGSNVNAIPITQDGPGEQLGYTIPSQNGLAPGNYFLQAYVAYKAALPDGDGASRIYDQMKPGLTTEQEYAFTLTPSQVLGSSVVLDPLKLQLKTDANVCP
jgi:hypothetical protein